jgi:hypothetical protein
MSLLLLNLHAHYVRWRFVSNVVFMMGSKLLLEAASVWIQLWNIGQYR